MVENTDYSIELLRFLMMLFSTFKLYLTVKIGVMCHSAFFDCDQLSKISYVDHRHLSDLIININEAHCHNTWLIQNLTFNCALVAN